MKRHLLVNVTIAVIILLMFVGCGKKEIEKVVTQEKTTQEKTDTTVSTEKPIEEQTITVWTPNRHDLDYMNRKVAEFNDSNKLGIKIEFIAHTEDYANLIKMAHQSGQAPDIILAGTDVAGFDLVDYATAEVITPITRYITDEFKSEIGIENLLFERNNVIDGNIYYIPTAMKTGRRLIYNKELFKKAGITEPPVTLAELIEVAKKVNDPNNGVYGFALPGKTGNFGRLLQQSAYVSGFFEYQYETGTYDFTGMKEAVMALREIVAAGAMFPGSVGLEIDPLRVQFAEGNIAMYGNSSQEIGVLNDQFPAKYDWEAAPVPSYTGEIKGALPAEPTNGWCMTTNTKNPDAAWAVIDYLMSAEVMVGYAELGLGIPTFKNVAKVAKAPEGIKGWSGFAVLPYEKVYPKVPTISVEGQNWRDAIWEACMVPEIDVDKLIEKLNKSYNDAYDKAIASGEVKRLIIKGFDPMDPSAGTLEYLDK